MTTIHPQALSRYSIAAHYALMLAAVLAWCSGTALAIDGFAPGVLHRGVGATAAILVVAGWVDALRSRRGSRWFSVSWKAISRSLDALHKLLLEADGRHRQYLRLLPGFMSLALVFATAVVLAGLPSAIPLDNVLAPTAWVLGARTLHRTLAAGLMTIAIVDAFALLLSRLPRRATGKHARPLTPKR